MLFVGTKTAVRTCRSGADDWVNTAAAGIGTGALFRMPGGLRSAAVGGVVGGLFAGAAMLAAKAPVFRRSTPGAHGNNTRHYSS
jgi:mitochondrial import inner membrane translocase subunit TIM23